MQTEEEKCIFYNIHMYVGLYINSTEVNSIVENSGQVAYIVNPAYALRSLWDLVGVMERLTAIVMEPELDPHYLAHAYMFLCSK